MRVWNAAIANALKTDDASVLQQIFFSLSQELIRMNKEIEDLKTEIKNSERQKSYMRIR
jgi:hypothetical protein